MPDLDRILRKLDKAEEKRNSEALKQERKFTQLFERFDVIHEKVEDILKEAKKTNGRIISLEFWRNSLKAKIGTTAFLVSLIASVLFGIVKHLIGG